MAQPHATAPARAGEFAPRTLRVLLPLALDTAYDYRLPEGLEAAPGAIVEVPLGHRHMVGVVWGEGEGGIAPSRLKDILAVRAVPPLPGFNTSCPPSHLSEISPVTD